MVFARTGQMDRAVDFIRRALYCYECAFIEVHTAEEKRGEGSSRGEESSGEGRRGEE
jgi:hypothetical protein